MTEYEKQQDTSTSSATEKQPQPGGTSTSSATVLKKYDKIASTSSAIGTKLPEPVEGNCFINSNAAAEFIKAVKIVEGFNYQ
jgi:hypothetical protein